MFVRLAPALFVCLWATGFIGARMGMPYAEPGTFLTVRFALAAVLLSAIVVIMKVDGPGWRRAGQAVTVGVFIHGIYLGGVFFAIDRGMPAGVAAVIVGLQPLLTAILAGLFLKEEITVRHWAAMAVGVCGVVLVVWPKFELTSHGITPLTVAACGLGMVSVTIGTVLQKAVGGGLDMRSDTALQYVGAAIPVGLLAVFTETRHVIWSGELVFAFVWLVFVLSFGAIFLLLWLIRQGSMAQVSSLFFMVPAVAALIAWILFGEALGPVQILGMVVCAIAVALVHHRPDVALFQRNRTP